MSSADRADIRGGAATAWSLVLLIVILIVIGNLGHELDYEHEQKHDHDHEILAGRRGVIGYLCTKTRTTRAIASHSVMAWMRHRIDDPLFDFA